MGAVAAVLAGLGGGYLSGRLQRKAQEREQQERTTAQQLHILQTAMTSPNLRPEAQTAVFDMMFSLAGDGGKGKKGGKGKDGAGDPMHALLKSLAASGIDLDGKQGVTQPGTARPPLPARDITPPAVAGGPAFPPTVLPPVPGLPPLPGHRSMFMSPEEVQARESEGVRSRIQTEEGARAPFREAEERRRNEAEQGFDKTRHKDRLEEIEATGKARTIRGTPAQDQRPGAKPWDYVTPMFHGDGSVTYESAKRPAEVDRVYNMAAAKAKRENLTIDAAWDATWNTLSDTKQAQLVNAKDADVERSQRMQARAKKMAGGGAGGGKGKPMTAAQARVALGKLSSTVQRRKADVTDELHKIPYAQALEQVSTELYGIPVSELRARMNGTPFTALDRVGHIGKPQTAEEYEKKLKK